MALFASIALAAGLAFVDAHAHPEAGELRAAVEAARARVASGEVAAIFLMPPPFADEAVAYDAEALLAALGAGARDRQDVRVLAGGGSLNVQLQRAVKSGDASAQALAQVRARAEELARLPIAGFGEMTAEHFAGATPAQSAPPDHPFLLALAEIAGREGLPIDLHLEALPSNVAAFERLLAHEPRARIVWAHLGVDKTGERTPALCRRLLSTYSNLYMQLKVDPSAPGKHPLLAGGDKGPIAPEWLQLIRDFPERFVIGSDQHYPERPAKAQRWQAARALLDALPAGLRERVARENAARIYRRGGER